VEGRELAVEAVVAEGATKHVVVVDVLLVRLRGVVCKLYRRRRRRIYAAGVDGDL
jgi:hypothetical protein